MIKVLLISPYKGTVGGISLWTSHIMDYYQGHWGTCIKLMQYYGENYLRRSVHGNDTKMKRLIVGLFTYIPLIHGVNVFFKKERPDVVHLCTSASFGLIRDYLILKMAKKESIKTIIHFRFGRIPSLLEENNWEKRLLFSTLKYADEIIVLDEKSINALKTSGFNNVRVLPNPVSERLKTIVKRMDVGYRDKNTILFVGHAIKTKGIYELVSACKEIPNICLHIVGFTPYETRSEILRITDGDDSWISYKGELSYEETITEMLKATLFVLPTYSEGFPNAVLESMFCGCAIITTPVGAIPEMLRIGKQDYCGVCVPVGSVDGLCITIKELLSNMELRNELGRRAHKNAEEKYDMTEIWSQLTALWQGN